MLASLKTVTSWLLTAQNQQGRRILGILMILLMRCSSVTAQCPEHWLPGEGVPGTNGNVTCLTMWDPDGPGPRSPLIAIGGSFTFIGSVAAGNIAAYDPQTREWFALGTGVDDSVSSLTAMPNGDLVVGGLFTHAGSTPTNHIARWNGTSWQPLGTGVNNSVSALCALADGSVIAGGNFTSAGGNAIANLARWDGASWLPVGGGVNGPVTSLIGFDNNFFVAGNFSRANGIFCNGIARWGGAAWTPLSSGVNGSISGLARKSNGDLIAIGSFSSASGTNVTNIALWNGTTWSALGAGVPSGASAVAVLPNNDVIAVGAFFTLRYVMRWNGTQWSDVGTGIDSFVYRVLALPSGEIVIGGTFTIASNKTATHLARWNGTSWESLSQGFGGTVDALMSLPNGDMIAAVNTPLPTGTLAYNGRTFRWNGSQWLQFGPTQLDQILTLRPLSGDEFIAGGTFAVHIMRWNGTQWMQLGGGVNGPVYTTATLPNGDLIAGGNFTTADGLPARYVARWNGSQWSAMGTIIATDVYSLLVQPNGDLFAGTRLFAGWNAAYVVKWNGSTWVSVGGSTAGAMNNSVLSMTSLQNGDIVAGGAFTTVGGTPMSHIARWNGVTWSPMGAGMNGGVTVLTTTRDGQLIAGGGFTTADGILANRTARWNGSQWFPMDSGLGNNALSTPYCFAWLPSGELALGGNFNTAGDAPSASFARYSFGGTEINITTQPSDNRACNAGSASFFVEASGSTPMLFQWQVQTSPGVWINLTSTPLTLPCGGTASAMSPNAAQTRIAISSCSSSNQYLVRCMISNTCGSISSHQASYVVCPADFNCDLAVNFFDYIDFVQALSNTQATADFNRDSVVDFFDYLDFVQAFANGC